MPQSHLHLARLEDLGCMAEYAVQTPGWDKDRGWPGTSSVLSPSAHVSPLLGSVAAKPLPFQHTKTFGMDSELVSVYGRRHVS